MKYRISISILLSILIIVIAMILINVYDDKSPEQNYSSTEELVLDTQDKSITTNQEYITYLFFIKDDGGRLTVYDAKTNEIFMQTGIITYSLSADLQEEIIRGIFFESEAELYDFLESYSS